MHPKQRRAGDPPHLPNYSKTVIDHSTVKLKPDQQAKIFNVKGKVMAANCCLYLCLCTDETNTIQHGN